MRMLVQRDCLLFAFSVMAPGTDCQTCRRGRFQALLGLRQLKLSLKSTPSIEKGASKKSVCRVGCRNLSVFCLHTSHPQ